MVLFLHSRCTSLGSKHISFYVVMKGYGLKICSTNRDVLHRESWLKRLSLYLEHEPDVPNPARLLGMRTVLGIVPARSRDATPKRFCTERAKYGRGVWVNREYKDGGSDPCRCQ
jgi:hypothetical protein